MSHIYSDENQVPSFFNDSKKRQSCPAQLQQRSFEFSSQILGDSTNLRKSFVENQMNVNYASQKESVSSRYSEPVYSSIDLMGTSLSSKSLLRKSVVRNSIIEEEPSSSKMKSSSIYGSSQIQNQNQNSQILCQDSSLSKRSSVSSSSKNSKENALENQSGQETFVAQHSQIHPSQEKKKGIVSKIITIITICLLAFLIVFSVKFFIAKGNLQGIFQEFSTEDYLLKNKYFEEQIFGQKPQPQQPIQVTSAIQVTTAVSDQDSKTTIESSQQENTQIMEQEDYQKPEEIETNNFQQQSSETTRTQNIQETNNQLNPSKQEMLVIEESEQFFKTLVKLVQKEKQISYQDYEKYLKDNCTPGLLEEVKAKMQSFVNESMSIKEELDIETGTRIYVSQEKY